MNIAKIKGINKLVIVVVFIFVTITSGIVISLLVLKEEAINNNIRVVELQSRTFADNLNQSINSLDLIFNSLSSILLFNQDKILFQKQSLTILKNNPYLRSINLLENNKIIASSNPLNINVFFYPNNFYQKAFLNQSNLQVGLSYLGKDLNEIYPENQSNNPFNNELGFTPLIKKIEHSNKVYYIVATLNLGYFINKYDSRLEYYSYIDILRISNKIFLEETSKSNISGIISFEDELYFSASSLTSDYPFSITVRTKYKDSLKEWDNTQYKFFIISTITVIMSVLSVLFLFFLYNKKHQKEIEEHKLQIENQKRFQVLFENNHFLSAIIKTNGTIQDINKKALSFLNQSYKQVINTTFWDLFCFNQTDKQWLKEIILNYKNNQHIQKELTIINSENVSTIIELMIMQIDTNSNKELLIMSSDVSQQKIYEYKIKEAYTVFQNTHDGIVITNKDVIIINANKAFERTSGYSLDEAVGKNPSVLKSGQHTLTFYKIFWRGLVQDGFWEGEIINKRKNGEFWTEWLTVTAIYDRKGEVENYIAVFHDTTMQKKHEKELYEKEKILMQQAKMASVGEVIENIAHQWRQPLSVISTIATGIELKYEYDTISKQEMLDELKIINETSQFLSQTIDDFRNFLTKTKIKKIFNLPKALEKALTVLQFKKEKICIIKNIDNLEHNGFESELIQVFLNLLNNCKDSFESQDIEDKYIFIDVYEEEKKIIILFKDTGGGIPEKIIDKIFEPYFTTKHQSQGTGIGLYMSRQIISNHLDGELSVSNIKFEYNNKNYTGACLKIVLNI